MRLFSPSRRPQSCLRAVFPMAMSGFIRMPASARWAGFWTGCDGGPTCPSPSSLVMPDGKLPAKSHGKAVARSTRRTKAAGKPSHRALSLSTMTMTIRWRSIAPALRRSARPSPMPPGAPPLSGWTLSKFTEPTAISCISSCRPSPTVAQTTMVERWKTACASRLKSSRPFARHFRRTGR
ncbi:hypothetical protein D9M72_506780 [compost metagenome]